jgi:hypothetical protein
MAPEPDNTATNPTQSDPAPGRGDYEPPSIIKVGDFAADTHGSVSVGSSDDSDAGQYYA